MDTKSLENYLEKFGDKVIKAAQRKLSKSKDALGKPRGATALGQSLRVTVTRETDGYSTKFFMADYGTFLDKGVSGNKTKQSFTDYKNKTQPTPYSYKAKGPPIDILSKWIKKKGIKPKGLGRGRSKKTGQFVSGFAYLISKKIKREGIKSLSFFQEPLGAAFKDMDKEILSNIKLDIESYVTTFYTPKTKT